MLMLIIFIVIALSLDGYEPAHNIFILCTYPDGAISVFLCDCPAPEMLFHRENVSWHFPAGSILPLAGESMVVDPVTAGIDTGSVSGNTGGHGGGEVVAAAPDGEGQSGNQHSDSQHHDSAHDLPDPVQLSVFFNDHFLRPGGGHVLRGDAVQLLQRCHGVRIGKSQNVFLFCNGAAADEQRRVGSCAGRVGSEKVPGQSLQ